MTEQSEECPAWSPSTPLLSHHEWTSREGTRSRLLSHPMAPFSALPGSIEEAQLQKIAFCYLTAANEQLKLPSDWLGALSPGTRVNVGLRWLPLEWPSSHRASGDPLVSYRVTHPKLAGDEGGERETIVLLASEYANGHARSQFGVRVVLHAEGSGSSYTVRITGSSACLPGGRYVAISEAVHRNKKEKLEDLAPDKATLALIARALHLEPGTVHFTGLRAVTLDKDEIGIEAHGTGRSASGRHATPQQAFTCTIRPSGEIISLAQTPLYADAGEASVFVRDPPVRPTRSEEILTTYRQRRKILEEDVGRLVWKVKGAELFHIAICRRFVLEDNFLGAHGNPKKVDLSKDLLARSNAFSAVMAFENVRDFFKRLDAYGLKPFDYFRTARLPLKVAYRSGVEPGPGKDGVTVNARVLPDGWGTDLVNSADPTGRPGLTIHLARGDLSTRSRTKWDGKHRMPAEPLGIAIDQRWIWHELGHVLLMATTGELELRFAHSPGDALAAIASDPGLNRPISSELRGRTFPFVFLPRRHDRCVTAGWGWNGPLHRDLLNAPEPPRRKGYRSEQILSTSLFRLYRILGGDSADDHARAAASHYCVHLIMSALNLLGPAAAVPANYVEIFVDALMEADIGRPEWIADYEGEEYRRIGGCAHKAIRWAFEAQGLYAGTSELTFAPGQPPPVDIFIEDGRPTSVEGKCGTIAYGAGSYTPVPLDWSLEGETPLWHASQQAVSVDRDGNVNVQVGNRGLVRADNVKVDIWWRDWSSEDPPNWDADGWTACTNTSAGPQSIDPGRTVSFDGFKLPTLKDRVLLMACASCPDDPSNIDPDSGLPCSSREVELPDLVATDNNLGLRIVPAEL